ncbi:Basic region leucin zipper containing protein [Klebsormidium nitens]|uniref:Basic region leucin zipper containing protein n=1 Tax=Klebsormidium nitens TaxID=105231 RepID=A0A1Y1HJD1_KLENI|nr:Basic region leucin zipper containing protein [Klebsormidium nitens]|eukprot:GAQ78630.1 Basic region leucin zipper containing protein [Klebsormidium nitens]
MAMEVEERCGSLGADLMEADDHLLENLWQSFGWDSPEAGQSGPDQGPGAADLSLDPESNTSCDWEKLLDAEEIQRIWPDEFTVDIEKLGPLPESAEGAAEPPMWGWPVGNAQGTPLPSFEPLPSVTGTVRKQAGASQTSSSVSQISSERQSNKKEPAQSGQVSLGGGQGKRSRSEDGDGSSEGDADSPEDSKKRARLVRNRESASQSRERKKQRMQDMEQRCASLEEQVRSLSRAVTATALENAALREELARRQMYHFPPAAATAPGRSRGRGAKKSNGTEPAVLSSDSLPWSSLFHRSTCPPSPLAPSPPLPQQRLLASGPFLLFVLLLAWLASPVGNPESRDDSQQVSSSSQLVCSLRVASLVRGTSPRRRRRGKRKARKPGVRSERLRRGSGLGMVFESDKEQRLAASAA